MSKHSALPGRARHRMRGLTRQDRVLLGLAAVTAVAAPIAVVATAGTAAATSSPSVVFTANRDQNSSSSSMSGPWISATASPLTLVAYLASDGPSTSNSQRFNSVSGCGLSWRLVARANAMPGTAEAWTATTSAALSSCRVSASRAVGGYQGSMSVVGYAGSAGVGASAAAANRGAPGVTVTPTKTGSLLYAVGNDWDNAMARTVPAGQSMVHQYLAPANDTYWVQKSNTATTAGTAAGINDSAPTGDRFDMVAVEVTPSGSAPAPSPSPTPSSTPTTSPTPTSSPTPSSTPTSSSPTPTSTPTSSSPTPTSTTYSCTQTATNGRCGPYSGYTAISGANSNPWVDQNVWAGSGSYHQTLYANGPGDWYISANANVGNGGVLTFPNTGFYMTGTVDASTSITSSWSTVFPHNAQTIGWSAYDLWLNNWANEIMIQTDISANSNYNCAPVASATFGGSPWHLCQFGSELVWKHGTDDSHLINESSGSVDVKAMLVWLEQHGFVPASSTWTAASFGFEVCNTTGIDAKFQVTGFSWSAK